MVSISLGFLVLHHLPEFAQIHVHRVGDAIQPSQPLSPPFPPALNLFFFRVTQSRTRLKWLSSSSSLSLAAKKGAAPGESMGPRSSRGTVCYVIISACLKCGETQSWHLSSELMSIHYPICGFYLAHSWNWDSAIADQMHLWLKRLQLRIVLREVCIKGKNWFKRISR